MELDLVQKKYPDALTFKFGDNEWLCKQLLQLVKDGRKTATCGALRDFESGKEPMPVVGRKDIALNWNGTPALVIETIKVEQKAFADVDETFAMKEGENDTLDGWRGDHQQYFARNGGFDEAMLLVCEEFKLVEVF